MRSPGAAYRRVALGIIGGVMRYRDDEFSFLSGYRLEEFLLQKLNVDHGKGTTGLLRCEDIAVAGGDGDLIGFTSAGESVCHVRIRECAAEHGIGILCEPPVRKANFEKRESGGRAARPGLDP